MSKRFTDTDKWKFPFLRGLKTPYKLLWLYLQDDCNHAGIWEVDIDVAKVRTGENDLDIDEAIKYFGNQVITFCNGQKWFIPAFIEEQYSELNQENRAHNSVIKLLQRYNLIEILDENKGLTRGLQARKDKDKDKDITNKEIESGIFKKIKHLSITKEEYNKLLSIGYTAEQVQDIFDAIANYKKITNYTSLYLTAIKWLKREFPQVTAAKQTAIVKPIYQPEPELETRKIKSVFDEI